MVTIAHQVLSVHQALSSHLSQFNAARHIYIAYSGGLDSHVLLHCMSGLVADSRLTALHINHQLSPNARRWAEHCRWTSESLGVQYICKKVEVAEGASRENAARQARYQAFETQLRADDLLLMAHHADDQAETILYRLLRRSGPRGLAGMPVSRSLGEAALLRPLLALERVILENYAASYSLEWIDDESNLARQFDRNFLRHDVIPLLRDRWPNYATRISDTGVLCEQAESLNENLAQLDLGKLSLRKERRGRSIEIQSLQVISAARQANVLRFLVRLEGFRPPGHRVLEEVLSRLLFADNSKNPVVSWPGGEWRRFRRRLYLLPPEVAQNEQQLNDQRLNWGLSDSADNTANKLPLPRGGTLSVSEVKGSGLAQQLCGSLEVSFRQGGERCRPVTRSASTSLKKLFQEFALEPWLRSSVPLIYCRGDLAAVGDLWVCEGFQAQADEPGYQLTWRC